MNQDFVNQIHALLPASEVERFFEALNTSPVVSVRRNMAKITQFYECTDKVKWCDTGKYLSERAQFTFDPKLHSGAYYVQDASSMILQSIVSRLLRPDTPVRCLDLCAAPGGKSTSVIDVLPNGSLMVCNEIMNNRAQILRENIIKWGAANCVVTNNDSKDFIKLGTFFDIVIVDAPCSGEGMFRKDDEAVSQWTPALVEQCAERQRMIVDNAMQILRPGGFLIYSTCTYNREENEKILDYMVTSHKVLPVNLDLPDEWGIRRGVDTEYPCYRFMPHITRGEGLFVGVVRKDCDAENMAPSFPGTKKDRNRDKNKTKTEKVPVEAVKAVKSAKEYKIKFDGENIFAIPDSVSSDVEMLSSSLRTIYRGVLVGGIKGRDFVPSQALVLSLAYNRDSYPVAEVDYLTAIQYLRGETITLPDAPRGIVAIEYDGSLIGFVKNLGNRANNLYPKEWRIKSAHIPEKPVAVL